MKDKVKIRKLSEEYVGEKLYIYRSDCQLR